MKDSDFKGFKNAVDALCDYYDKDYLNEMSLKIYFRAMRDYELDQVSEAASKHLADPKAGQYFPKASDLIRHLEGGEITPDQVVAAAKLANCPMGVMARIHIGTWDLNNMDGYYLRQRAQEVIQILPEWKKRASAGDYTDHEVSIMLKHGIDPCEPFFQGLCKPDNQEALRSRVALITQSPRHLALIESNQPESEPGKQVALSQTIAEAEAKSVSKTHERD